MIVLPIVTLIDAWRFPARAWRVTGQPRWLWALLPVCLVGAAFVPFGVWWFRALLVAADACCVLYLVKVRPMLPLDRLLDEGVAAGHPTATDHRGSPVVVIDARPADPSTTSALRRWIAPYESFFGAAQSRPRVVAVNGHGKELVLFTKNTWDETVAARNRVRDDFVRMGPDAWARRYGVPDDFLG